MKITCLDCGHRAPASKCDSGLVAAGTRQSEMLGQIVTIGGERRQYGASARCSTPHDEARILCAVTTRENRTRQSDAVPPAYQAQRTVLVRKWQEVQTLSQGRMT